MNINNSCHALGSQTYSMGDIHLTNILTRLNVNPKFFKDQMKLRPQLLEYYNRVKTRPSYIKANMNYPAIPNTIVTTCGLLIFNYFLSLIIWGIYGAYKVYTLDAFLLIFASVSILIYFLIILIGCIGKCRLTTFQNEMKRNQEQDLLYE